MNVVGVLVIVIVALNTTCDGLSLYESRNAIIHSFSRSVFIKTFVLNCFPSSEKTAFITFERDRVSRLKYGQLSIVNAALQPNSDFVIQFRERLTDIVDHNLTDYGFMEPRLHSGLQILLVIGRGSSHPHRPKHHLQTFDQYDVEAESSRLYVYNAVWNRINQGINVYGLYHRSNVDGSESESVTRLIDNLGMNEGREISLEPDKKLHIKDCSTHQITYRTIGSVLEFKNFATVLEKEEFIAVPGIRYYLVMCGDYATMSKAKPSLRIMSGADSPSSANFLVPTLISLTIFTWTTLLLV